MRKIVCLLIVLVYGQLCAQTIEFKDFDKREFNPSNGQILSIPVSFDQPGNLILEIYTPDNDLVRTISAEKVINHETYTFDWDGKDQNGDIVPNEAYVPVLTNQNEEGETYTVDPRHNSGGEVISAANINYSADKISFDLEHSSRVLIRAGIKPGPMLNSILNWQPRLVGHNVVLWNGHDQDNVIDLRGRDDFALLVTGYRLPDYSILTTGNNQQNYSSWREKNQWPSIMPDFKGLKLQRNDQRISRHYYLPTSVNIEPKISLTIVDDVKKNIRGAFEITGSVSVKVDIAKADQWAMQQSRYEVAFFVDNQIISEQEQGYVPLTWRWNPIGFEVGQHTLTVNVSGFNGQVGVKSLAIEILDE